MISRILCKNCGVELISIKTKSQLCRKCAAIKYNTDPKVRHAKSERGKISMNRHDIKQHNSDCAKKRWTNPEERKLQSERLKVTKNNPENKKQRMKTNALLEVKQRKSDGQIKRYTDLYHYENHLIRVSGQGFWYGHPFLCPENKKGKRYCELWNRSLWVRIDAAWDYKSAISGVTRWENYHQRYLDRHHVYWQEGACCVWDEDVNGYYAPINIGTKVKPNIIKYYIQGDPNKFVLLTRSEHTMVRGSKKSGKDKIYWVKYFEDLIEKREAEGKKCYLSKEEYEVYKVEHSDTIAHYTQKPQTFLQSGE